MMVKQPIIKPYGIVHLDSSGEDEVTWYNTLDAAKKEQVGYKKLGYTAVIVKVVKI